MQLPAIVRVVAGNTFAFHRGYFVHRGFFVAGVADLFLWQDQSDGGLTLRDADRVTDCAGAGEIEMNGLSRGLFRVAGQALAAFGNLRMVGRERRRRCKREQENVEAMADTHSHRASPVGAKLTPATVYPAAR